MNRKQFVKTCGLACLGASSLGLLLQSCGTSGYVANNTISHNKITVAKTEFINPKDAQKPRPYILLKPSQLAFPICVFNISKDEYSAVYMECTHKSCELHNNGQYLQCPCHGSEFSNTGIVQNPPAEQNLKTFTITTDAQNIYIHV